MELNPRHWQEGTRMALAATNRIQVLDGPGLDIEFYQWLLHRARAGLRVELLVHAAQADLRGDLTPAYFRHLEAAGGRVCLLPEDTSLSAAPCLLLERAVIYRVAGQSRFEPDERPETLERYSVLFRQLLQSGNFQVSDAAAPPSVTADQEDPNGRIHVQFGASAEFVDIHERFELRWTVEGATEVRIEPLLGRVAPKGHKILSAESSVEFLLTARNDNDAVSRLLNVEVNPAPWIEYLLTIPGREPADHLPLQAQTGYPDRYGVVKGQELRLYYRVYNANTVRIDGSEAPERGNLLLTPESFRAYTIEALGADGQAVSRSILVDVFPRPEIEQIRVAAPHTLAVETSLSTPAVPQPEASEKVRPPGKPEMQGGNSLRNFFWFCSGASREILETCPATEGIKYAGIGGTVFFTGLLAALSGGYALWVAFESLPAALLFGLVWGAVIFNLDRLIVSTLKKDGSGSIWRQALPRIALALVLSVVIAKPLELRIFRPEILEILAEKKAEKLRAAEAVKREKIILAERRIENLKKETQALYQQREALYQEYRCECDGTCGTGRVGRGSECARKEAKYLQADREYQDLKKENDRLIADVRKEMEAADLEGEQAARQIAAVHAQGLVARLGAAQELPFWPGFFIALLIFLVEVAPVLSKILAPAGAYELAIRIAETRFSNAQDALLEADRSGAAYRSQLRVRLHQQEMNSEMEQKQELLRLVADAQMRLVRDQMDRWLEQERKKIRGDRTG